MSSWSNRILCTLLCVLVSMNIGIIDFSLGEFKDEPSKIVFGFNQTIYKTGEWYINSTEIYSDVIIDLKGNLTLDKGGVLLFNHVELRMNITAENQNYKIFVGSESEFYILSNSTITDGPSDLDTGTGEDPDFRYIFQISQGKCIIKNSSIREVGKKDKEDTFRVSGYFSSFLMENSTLSYSWDGLRVHNTRDVEIKYCTFRDIYHLGVFFDTVDNSKLINLKIDNITNYGLYLNYGTNNLVKNCFINKTGSYGIYWYSGTYKYLINSTFKNLVNRAIYFNSGTYGYIYNNYIENCSSNAMEIYRSQYVYIENNTIISSYRGIYCNAYRDINIIKNNIINHIPSEGIVCYRVIDSEIQNNFLNDTYYAFNLYYCERVTVSDNIFLNTKVYGAYVRYSKNIIINNNYFNYTGSYVLWSTTYSSYKYLTFENNICEQVGAGVYSENYYYLELRNNKFIGRGGNWSVYTKNLYNLHLYDNLIKNFGGGIYCYSFNYYNPYCYVYGGSIEDISGNHFHTRYRVYGLFYNLSFDESKIYFEDSYYSPYVKIYYNVDVKVEDTEGPVGGARVTVRDNSGGGLGDITEPTDETGWARSMTVLSKIKYSGSTKTYNKYNFSSNVSGEIANASAEYVIDKYKTITIKYNSDTEPTPPVDLRLEVAHDKIILKWECYVTDLYSYKIFRNDTGGGWKIVDIEAFPAPGVTKSWEDAGKANRLLEYRYKVHHVDNSFQEEMNNEWIVFNDWVITEEKSITNKEVKINGSLIIESGGDLDLRNVSVVMNGTDYNPGIKNIEVRSGGRLVLRDFDENNLTTYDRSFVNASKAADHFSFVVRPGGNLEIYNSWIQNSSYPVPGGSASLYINSDNCTIQNSTFITRSHGIYFYDSRDCQVETTTIKKDIDIVNYQYGISIIESRGLTLKNNLIDNASVTCIDLEDSENVNIINNELIIRYIAGVSPRGISLINTKNININNNVINNTYIGFSLSYNENIEIANNIITNCTYRGIQATDSNYVLLKNNNFEMTDLFSTAYGMEFQASVSVSLLKNVITGFKYNTGTTIGAKFLNFYELNCIGNDIQNVKTGIYLQNTYSHSMNSVNIGNNVIHDLFSQDAEGIKISSASDMNFFSNEISDARYAIYQINSKNTNFENESIKNVIYGFYFKSGSSALVINSSTDNGCPYPVYLNTSSSVIILNSKFNLSKIYISDRTCEANIQWFINFRLKDHFGNYKAGIFLRVRSITGTILYEKYTDDFGLINNLIIDERVQYYDENISFTPTHLEAEYQNHTFFSNVVIDHDMVIDIKMGNSAPEVYDVFITPLLPQTEDELHLNKSYTYVDKEFDKESNSIYQWFRNGKHIAELDNQTTVKSNYTAKGDTWYCNVTPCDQLDYGNPSRSITVLIFNTKPVASNAKLLPENPDGLQDLIVEYDYFDVDGEEELGSLYYWYVKSGQTFSLKYTTSKPRLSHLNIKEGEEWYVEVDPKDGEEYGIRGSSNTVKIGNTVPSLKNVRVTPAYPTSENDISVVYDFIDVDGDPEVNTTYRWWKWYFGLPENIDFIDSGFKTKSVPSKYLTKGEIWICQVTPHDGSEYGMLVNSTPALIDNTPPMITNVRIEPPEPKSEDNITVYYDYTDRDSDIESGTQFEWFKIEDNKKEKTGIRIQTLPSILTQKGEVWLCEVTPSDGFSTGKPVQTQSIQINNSAPEALMVSLTPAEPFTTDVLRAAYIYNDVDSDKENGTEIKWYKNRVHQPDLDNLMTVPNNITVKDESWYFTVTPSQGLIKGISYFSNTVLIHNTVPQIIEPKISPELPTSSDDLATSYKIYEPDNDEISSYEIKWFKNGIWLQQYNNLIQIPSDATEKGQVWKYEIRIFDGEDYSEFYESTPVSLKNSAPTIVGYLPRENVIELNESKSQSFTVAVIDNDGDIIGTQWFKNGVIVSSEQSYVFNTDYKSAGDYTINVTIQDWGEGSVMVSHEWSVKVRNFNRPPEIHIEAPLETDPIIGTEDSLKFQITYIDPDVDDIHSVNWYVGDELVKTSSENHYTFESGRERGNHVITVEVEDGHDSSFFVWNVTVEPNLKIQTEWLGITWDQWSIVLEALVILTTGIVAFIGFLTLRKRKGALQHYMRDMEELMRGWTADPDNAEKKLVELSTKIEKDFAEGRIEDFHYFLLDRQVKENLREIRQSKIRLGFASLPEHLRRQVNVVLEDGRITDKEYKKFVSTIKSSDEVSSEDKERLRKIMRTWKDIDTTGKAKKVKVKAAAFKKKMLSKYDAGELGWEDLSAQRSKHKAKYLGWEEIAVDKKKVKREKYKAYQLGWQDIQKETLMDDTEPDSPAEPAGDDDMEVWD